MNRPIARAPIAHGIGSVLRVLFRGLHAVRRPRPIHTRGVMLTGHVEWVRPATADRPSGIAWVDAPPPARRSPVVARLSRSIGLPAPLPDIIGLAVRVETDDGDADIEFASTGTSVPLRFALLPHRRPSRARFGILLPYRGTHGPVLLRARTLGPPLPSGGAELDRALEANPWRLGLFHATPLGPWHPFAVLTLRRASDQTDTRRFDAGRRLVPGARAYAWVRAVRQPSYDLVQRDDPH